MLTDILASKAVFVGFTVAAVLATAVVAVGLFLEYERSEDARKRIGNRLVVAGVVLEALFGLIAFISADIRDSRSELQIATLTVQAAELEKETAEAGARAERFRLDIAEANKRAEEAELDLQRFKAPRTLTDAQVADISGKVDKFVDEKIDFCVYPNNVEISQLANEIAVALHAAKWTLNAFSPLGVTARTWSGLAVLVDEAKADTRAKEAAEALADALRSNGLVTAGPLPKIPADDPGGSQGSPKYAIRLVIGAKP